MEGAMRSVSLLCMLFLLCESSAYAAFWELFRDSAENVTATDGNIILDVSDLNTSSSRHYRYQHGQISVKFFLVRDSQNIVRAAIDACEVCWREGKGYVMQNEMMLCKNCGRVFPLNRIGIIVGGCNPHPFNFSFANNSVTITSQELLSGAKYFPGNRQ
jgi:uncharacterized membrane protein